MGDFHDLADALRYFLRCAASLAPDTIIDEFHPCRFQRMLNRCCRSGRCARRFRAALDPAKRRQRDAGPPRQFGLLEAQKGTGSADLIRGYHER